MTDRLLVHSLCSIPISKKVVSYTTVKSKRSKTYFRASHFADAMSCGSLMIVLIFVYFSKIH